MGGGTADHRGERSAIGSGFDSPDLGVPFGGEVASWEEQAARTYCSGHRIAIGPSAPTISSSVSSGTSCSATRSRVRHPPGAARRVVFPCLGAHGRRDSAIVGVMALRDLPIRIDEDKVAEFCRARGIRRLRLFGSVLREDFDPTRSDVDVLAEFHPEALRNSGWEFFLYGKQLGQIGADIWVQGRSMHEPATLAAADLPKAGHYDLR